jgi:hypothetical protein
VNFVIDLWVLQSSGNILNGWPFSFSSSTQL